MSAAAVAPAKRRYDRSIVEGPLQPAVWKIAWPGMLTNAIGGLQGMIDHALVGHLVGFKANAAIGVSWQIFIVVIVFISSLFTGMSVLVARFAGASDEEKSIARSTRHFSPPSSSRSEFSHRLVISCPRHYSISLTPRLT